MIIGVEIDMVVENSLKAFNTYEKVFDAEKIESTDYEKGLNEVIFTIAQNRFHLIDENKEYDLVAPTKDTPTTQWFNIITEDIEETYNKAKEEKFKIIQPITEIKEIGAKNTILTDPYGYQWMIHQITEKVSYEKIKKEMEKQLNIEQ